MRMYIIWYILFYIPRTKLTSLPDWCVLFHVSPGCFRFAENFVGAFPGQQSTVTPQYGPAHPVMTINRLCHTRLLSPGIPPDQANPGNFALAVLLSSLGFF